MNLILHHLYQGNTVYHVEYTVSITHRILKMGCHVHISASVKYFPESSVLQRENGELKLKLYLQLLFSTAFIIIIIIWAYMVIP